jgi:hypothetical protein
MISLNQSYIASWINAGGGGGVIVQQGSRVGTSSHFNCGVAVGASLFGAFITTTGYARTRFTGLELKNATVPKFNPACGLVNTNIYIGTGVDFTTLPQVEIGLELNHSFVYCPAVFLGVASKIGMYIHSGSVFTLLESVATMPTLRGKTIGDISVDRTTRKTTWEAANLATVSDTTEMVVIKKGYVGLF